jgi:hypothetical protein
MAAESIAYYQKRIAELEESEDKFAQLLGHECVSHAATRRLAVELAEAVRYLYELRGWPTGEGQTDELLGKARIAGLL